MGGAIFAGNGGDRVDFSHPVTPAKAGAQGHKWQCPPLEIPAFAGMTDSGRFWQRAVLLQMTETGWEANPNFPPCLNVRSNAELHMAMLVD